MTVWKIESRLLLKAKKGITELEITQEEYDILEKDVKSKVVYYVPPPPLILILNGPHGPVNLVVK